MKQKNSETYFKVFLQTTYLLPEFVHLLPADLQKWNSLLKTRAVHIVTELQFTNNSQISYNKKQVESNLYSYTHPHFVRWEETRNHLLP